MRTNYAPTAQTIIVALVLMIVGIVGTYGAWVPDLVGILAFVGAAALLLIGMATRQL
jgi:hypothetical protein